MKMMDEFPALVGLTRGADETYRRQTKAMCPGGLAQVPPPPCVLPENLEHSLCSHSPWLLCHDMCLIQPWRQGHAEKSGYCSQAGSGGSPGTVTC